MLTARARAADLPASKSVTSASSDCGKDLLLSAPHAAGGAMRPFRVCVSKHVQRAVYDDPGQLLADTNAVLHRVAARHVRRNVDVTDYRAARRARPSAVQLERYDVGRTGVPQEFSVHSRDRRVPNERNRDQRLADSFATAHGAHDLAHPLF